MIAEVAAAGLRHVVAPAALVRELHERVGRGPRVVDGGERGRDGGLVDLVEEPVAAEQPPRARIGRGLPRVDLDVALFADHDPQRLQAQATAVAAPAGREEHLVETRLGRAVMPVGDEVSTVAAQLRDT